MIDKTYGFLNQPDSIEVSESIYSKILISLRISCALIMELDVERKIKHQYFRHTNKIMLGNMLTKMAKSSIEISHL